MEELPLTVFALRPETVTLRLLQDALREADCPASIGVGIAGDATDEDLDDTAWETAFVRWHEPELHEVYLLERDVVGVDEAANLMIAKTLPLVGNRPDSAGKLIVADHLRKTQVVYGCEVLPALLEDDDHLAWAALDIVLRALAENTDGLIYARAESFYDADGEVLLEVDG